MNAGSEYVALGLSMVVHFFMTAYLLRTVGRTEYGLLVLAFQSTLLLSVVSRAITQGFQRFAAADYARGDLEAMNNTMSIGLVLSIISALAFAAASAVVIVFGDVIFGLEPELLSTARLLIIITASEATIRLILRVWLVPVYIAQRFYFVSITSIVHLLLLVPAALLAFRLYHPDIVIWISLKSGILVAATWLIQRPLCRRVLPELAPDLRRVKSWKQMKTLAAFSGLGSLGQLAAMLFYASDSIIISNLDVLGPGMIAYYAVAQRWDPQIRSLMLAFAGVLTPMLASDFALGNLDRIRHTFTRAVRYCLILALYPCLVLMFFATPFMTHWLTSEYAEVCAPLLRLILTGFILGVPGYVSYEVLMGCGRIGKQVAFTFCCAVGNIVLSVFLVKVAGMGLTGVAIGSVTMLTLSNGIATPCMACRKSGLPIGRFFLGACTRPLLGAIPLAACAGLILRYWSARNLLTVFLQFAVCGLVYAVSVWHVSLTPADRSKVTAASVVILRRVQLLLFKRSE